MNYYDLEKTLIHANGKSKTFGSCFGQTVESPRYHSVDCGFCCWIEEAGKSPNRGFRTIRHPWKTR